MLNTFPVAGIGAPVGWGCLEVNGAGVAVGSVVRLAMG